MPIEKQKTNEQCLRALLKDCHTMEIAIIRERMLTWAEDELKLINENPTKWDNPIFHHGVYMAVMEKIIHHLKMED